MIMSILKGKCPRCRKGDLFVDKNPYHLKKLSSMHESCSCCKQPFAPEPGFYYGAMYVSYALSVVVFIVNFVLFALLFPLPPLVFILLNTAVLLLLWPVFFRLARIIYLNIFVGYDPEISRNASC